MPLNLSPDYQINWPFGSGEEVQTRFPRDRSHGGHLGFLIGTFFALFLSTSHPKASYQSQYAFRFCRGSEK